MSASSTAAPTTPVSKVRVVCGSRVVSSSAKPSAPASGTGNGRKKRAPRASTQPPKRTRKAKVEKSDGGKGVSTPSSLNEEPKRKTAVAESACPVCGLVLTPATFDAHMQFELDRVAAVTEADLTSSVDDADAPTISGVASVAPNRSGSRREAALHARKKLHNHAAGSNAPTSDHALLGQSTSMSSTGILKAVRKNREERAKVSAGGYYFYVNGSIPNSNGVPDGSSAATTAITSPQPPSSSSLVTPLTPIAHSTSPSPSTLASSSSPSSFSSSSSTAIPRRTDNGSNVVRDVAADDATAQMLLDQMMASELSTSSASSHGRATSTRGNRRGGQTCPICSRSIRGDVNAHVDRCLLQTTTSTSASPSPSQPTPAKRGRGRPRKTPLPPPVLPVDDYVETTESYEEYTWGDETRIRACSLLDGGYAGVGVGTSSSSRQNDDEDEELDIDDDGSTMYGSVQYSTTDLDTVDTDEKAAPVPATKKRGRPKSSSSGGGSNPTPSNDVVAVSSSGAEGGPSKFVIEALKARVRELEKKTGEQGQALAQARLSGKKKKPDGGGGSSGRCLICLGNYVTPLVSILCWHTHCESCWLRTLKAKKLCPQCQFITTPANLRRIYL
eukprot:TRINITY_DN3288_c0_g1_i1.p1 TRINITY_DN3288_c0_g1~~TRINITY_DN3288_c0_g1_i1.p1  ORF type:complete len:615 (+),score=129.30 TRINITY_DN3288_c0_g1_i1:203-2047(+)